MDIDFIAFKIMLILNFSEKGSAEGQLILLQYDRMSINTAWYASLERKRHCWKSFFDPLVIILFSRWIMMNCFQG
jgi:hypothetical protein